MAGGVRAIQEDHNRDDNGNSQIRQELGNAVLLLRPPPETVASLYAFVRAYTM